MTAPNAPHTDDVGFGLALILVGAGIIILLSLGPAALIGVAIPWLVVWFTGRSSFAVPLLIISAMGLAGSAYFGHLLPAIWAGYTALTSPSQNLVLSWLLLAVRADIVPVAVGSGLLVGALARLALQDKQADRQAESDKEASPAPLARIRTKQNISSSAISSDGQGSILGTDAETGDAVILSDRDANHHAIIVGATGTGKSVTSTNIVQSHLERGLPVVFLDGKGDIDLAQRLKAVAEKLGRPAFVFHHNFDSNLDDACAYNPFSSADFTALANLVTTLRTYSEPHYEILQKGYMQTVFKVAKATDTALDLLALGELSSVNAMVAAVRKNRHKIPDAQTLLTEIQEQRKAEEDGVESLLGTIRNLANSSMGPLFDTTGGRPVLKLSEARQSGAFVYFSLPALIFPDLSQSLGRMIINDVRLTLATGKGPWLIVLEELSTYSCQQILALVNQGRSFGARVLLLGQSFADLEKAEDMDGKAFRNQILGSVNTAILHRLNSPDDAELAAQIAGTFLKPEVTAQTVGNQPTGAGSVRMTREFHVGPDRIKKLRKGEAVILSKFGKPIRKINVRLPDFMK